MDLTTEIKGLALARGADVVGIAGIEDFPDHQESIKNILPSAKRLVVTLARHSLAALSSGVNEIRQFDAIHTYDESARAAHSAVRLLADRGYEAAAIPAFIPLDMGAPKKGMRGEIDWRRAGVLAGLGSYGENGLLVTSRFGSAVRICGLLTNAPLIADKPLGEDVCDHCMECVRDCPTGALTGEGKIDKKKCGDHIFRHGFRAFQGFMRGVFDREEQARSTLDGQGLRELWQNFMTGNYYYCFRCQIHCHRSDKLL
jgi:epoxyqueuosine reductase